MEEILCKIRFTTRLPGKNLLECLFKRIGKLLGDTRPDQTFSRG